MTASSDNYDLNGPDAEESVVTDSVPRQEAESEVYCPGRWLGLTVGTVFLLAGAIGLLSIGDAVPPGLPFWTSTLFAGVFALLGGTVTALTLGRIMFPALVRHASPKSLLPNVPQYPIIYEGSWVYARLTNDVSEYAQGWHFQPAAGLRRYEKGLLLGFGVPVLLFSSGLLTWVFHSQLGWVVAAAFGIGLTALCGGTAFVMIGMLMRSGYSRLSPVSHSTQWKRP